MAYPSSTVDLSDLTLSSTSTISNAAFSSRVLIKSIISLPDGGASLSGQRFTVGGWVKTGREQGKGKFAFLELNDGSCPGNLQVIIDSEVCNLAKLTQTGTSVYVEGVLKKTPEGTRQKIELKVDKVIDIGSVDTCWG
ncbi:asparagine--tRNA ligase [Ranunculus cassubicifolius]